jgi:hypothetical protein
MFVRWQLYRSQALFEWHRKHNDKRARLKAVLVESERVEGRPRQRHVAFLGSTTIDAKDHLDFWCQVTKRLDRLDNRLTPQDREQVIAAIAKRLGEQPPTEAQLAKHRRDGDQLLTGFWSIPRP